MKELIYSTDPHDWVHHRDSLAEIINDKDVKAGDIVYVGEKEPMDVNSIVSVDSVIDDMSAQVEDLIDTSSYDNPVDSLTDDAKKELEDFLCGWAKKHIDFNLFHIVNVREVSITQEMIDLAKNNELPEDSEQ